MLKKLFKFIKKNEPVVKEESINEEVVVTVDDGNLCKGEDVITIELGDVDEEAEDLGRWIGQDKEMITESESIDTQPEEVKEERIEENIDNQNLEQEDIESIDIECEETTADEIDLKLVDSIVSKSESNNEEEKFINTELTESIVELAEEIYDINETNNNIIENITTEISEDVEVIYNEIEIQNKLTEEVLGQDDLQFIIEAKSKRGKGIKAIDVYTQEEQIFKTHKECSRKLKVPIGYIKENLKYGYTDYLGDAINYLGKELQTSEYEVDEFAYLDTNKTPMEQFNTLNNKIFSEKISEDKRDEILSSEKIEPVKMHYKFECIDNEYDDYFNKYKSIIKRGGKKKIEIIDKKGEAIEVFKSIDDCANYFKKDRNEIVDMLKYGETKIGRQEIRYSLRNI